MGGKQDKDPNADGEPTAPTTPGGFGQVLDAPEPEGDDGDTIAEQAREWKIAVEQAENVAKLAGNLPVDVTRNLEQSEAAGVDWRELLRRAWSETIPSDYSWMPPNRRHIWAGLGCIFRVSGLKVRRRSQSRSIAQDRQRTSAWTLRGGDSLHSRRTTAEPGACALLRYRGAQD